jgi:hypothetical protein
LTREGFAEALVRYCERFDGTVLVWGETKKHRTTRNPRCGLLHLWWLAADVVYDRTPPFPDRRDVASALGLVVVPLPKYDHVSAATFALREG